MTNLAKDMDVMLRQLEDELLASDDADILAGPGAEEMSQRVAELIKVRLRPNLQRAALPVRVPGRRDRRGNRQDLQRPGKRQMVDRVLVASPKAHALVKPEQVAMLSDEELDQLLLQMRALGLLSSDD